VRQEETKRAKWAKASKKGKLHRKRKVDNSFRQKGKCGKGK
jgi:hypothetical protein